jgi:hypothetical protein
MRQIHTRSLFLIMAILLSACGTATTPTIAPVDVQNTAMAAALTILAETQASIPTNTLVPPTETPTETLVPTETPVILPSLEATPTSTQVAGSGDPCNAPLQSISGGDPAKIKIENDSGAPITLSLYLNKTPFGDCGYRGYSIGKAGSILITDLIQGCYNVSVFVNDPKKPTKSFGYGCINNPDKWTFFVTRESVTLQGR